MQNERFMKRLLLIESIGYCIDIGKRVHLELLKHLKLNLKKSVLFPKNDVPKFSDFYIN